MMIDNDVDLTVLMVLLKCTFKCGFCSKLYTIEVIPDDADMDFFVKWLVPVIVFILSIIL